MVLPLFPDKSEEKMDFSISTLYVNLLLAVTLLMVLVVLYFKWIYSYWNRKGVANFPAVIPFGNAKEVVLQTVSLGLDVEKFYKQFKKLGVRYAGYYFLNRPIFIPMDLELIKMILTKDFQHFVNHGVYINEEVRLSVCSYLPNPLYKISGN